jgi:hypothetical protein
MVPERLSGRPPASRPTWKELRKLIGLDEFANGDPERFYARMRPDQRTAVANEFVRVLHLAGDPHADDFRYAAEDRFAASGEDYAPPEESSAAQPLVPHLLSPDEASRVHRYTREHHPELVDTVARHPVTQAALAFPGAPPEPVPPEESEEAAAPPGSPTAAFVGGSGRDALTPEYTRGTWATLGLGVGEIEKRDHDPIHRTPGPDADQPQT